MTRTDAEITANALTMALKPLCVRFLPVDFDGWKVYAVDAHADEIEDDTFVRILPEDADPIDWGKECEHAAWSALPY